MEVNNNNNSDKIDSNLIAKSDYPLTRYNKPSRREAMLEIRRLLIEQGLSHNEIQIHLHLPPATYFRYLDLLFESEQEMIAGNNYTYQRLLNETLILSQRFLRRARRLEKIADDPTIDAESRIKAEVEAGEYERACHDMCYMAPSYLANQGLLPGPKKHDPTLTMTRITRTTPEEQDPSEFKRLTVAGAMRMANKAAIEAEAGKQRITKELPDKLQKKLRQPEEQEQEEPTAR